MTDDTRRRPPMDAQIEAAHDRCRGSDAAGGPGPAPREALDREEQLIRDAVLRMGALVEDGHPRGEPGADRPRRRARARGHQGRRDHQRGAAGRLAAHLGDDRDPAAGRPRPALSAHARSRHVRARADGRPCRLGRQAVIKLAPEPPLEQYVHLPEMAERGGGPRPRRPAGARRIGRGRGPRDRGRRTTRSTGSTTRPSTRSSS